MSILDTLTPRQRLPDSVPPKIEGRVRRGRAAKDKDRNVRRLCQKFWEGNHYWYIDARTGNLGFQTSGAVGIVGNDKTPYRIRNTYNFIQSIVEAKASAATQRIPGYEVTPSTDDPDDEAAASLASQVAAYGYDKWLVRRHTVKAVTNALVQREGFVMPYFDPNVGPFTEGENGWEGQGELRLLDLSRDEVMWEPGVDFEDSRWHAIERARLKDEVRQIPGYTGGDLTNDAKGSAPEGKSSEEMVLVTEYLERPCPDYPMGRRCFIANNRLIVDYRRDPDCDPTWAEWWEPYPNMDANGTVVDEPVIHRISYTVNPNGDDLGLTERLIDPQRTISDAMNKMLELKNRALVLQMSAPRGSNVTRRDDSPGSTWYYNVVGGQTPQWEPPPNPQMLAQLMEIYRLAVEQIRALAADVDVQPDPRLAAATASQAVQQSQARWQGFLGDLADFHSRLMRHCLTLVARYYSEQRQIDIRGQYGWAPLKAFTGQDLRSQVNVRVLPGSLDTKSRESIKSEIEFIATTFPGALSPEAVLGVLHGGSAEGLIRSYQNQVAKAARVVRRLRMGPQAMADYPTRFDQSAPNLALPPNPDGTPQLGVNVPGWMPAPWDNVKIWRTVIGDYMATEDFENHDPATRHCFELVWDGLETAEKDRAAKQAAMQQQQAQSLGMANAGAPQLPPPLPSQAGFTPENQSPVPTP